jgi:tetratricopeptide (TPR) repeat protein
MLAPRHLVLALLSLRLLAGETAPAEQRIEVAQKRIRMDPKSWQAYNDLAFAFCRQARNSGDPAWLDQAEAALRKSFELSPNNYDARKLHVTVLLGRDDFKEALRLAAELNHKTPDDIAGWGLLVDANLGLGNNAEAEKDAQWILDLRPGSTLGFAKAAAVRERIGDPEGAIEFLDEARRRTSPNDLDEQAWLLKQRTRLAAVK